MTPALALLAMLGMAEPQIEAEVPAPRPAKLHAPAFECPPTGAPRYCRPPVPRPRRLPPEVLAPLWRAAPGVCAGDLAGSGPAPAPVPAPSSLLLLVSAGGALGALRGRRRG